MGDVSRLTPAGAEPVAGAAATGQAGLRKFFGRLVREQPLGTAGGIVILLLVLVSIFADSGWRPIATRRSTCATACRAPRRSTCWAPTTRGGTS